jgi:hypothetical protein
MAPLMVRARMPCPAQAVAEAVHFEEEIEINDFPQNARWKVTHKVRCTALPHCTPRARRDWA